MKSLLEEAIARDKDFVENVKDMEYKDKGIHIFSFETDSTNLVEYDTIVVRDLKPSLECLGYGMYEIEKLDFCLGEAYLNAIIHGNKAGKQEDYTKRNLPIPTDLENNKKKVIFIDAFICDKFYILRITDQGEGFDIHKQIEHEKSLITSDKIEDKLKVTGRGLYTISKYVNNIFSNKTEGQFSVTVIKYNK